MQKKIRYYEKWVERHVSFTPRQSVKTSAICRGEGVKKGENLSRSYMDGPYGKITIVTLPTTRIMF